MQVVADPWPLEEDAPLVVVLPRAVASDGARSAATVREANGPSAFDVEYCAAADGRAVDLPVHLGSASTFYADLPSVTVRISGEQCGVAPCAVSRRAQKRAAKGSHGAAASSTLTLADAAAGGSAAPLSASARESKDVTSESPAPRAVCMAKVGKCLSS